MSSVRKVERFLKQGNMRGLCRMLRDRNLLVKRQAAQALGKLGHAGAVPFLADTLNRESDEYVIRYALDALALIGDHGAVDVLVLAMFGSRKRIARLAEGVLKGMQDARAQAAVIIQRQIMENDWDNLFQAGEQAGVILGLVLRSEQYATWPAGKRRKVAHAALQLGGTLPRQHSKEFANMGLFVSGVHTLGDVLQGLDSSNPAVRAAAAEKLGASGLIFTRFALRRRFRQEIKIHRDNMVMAAIGQALEKLNDPFVLTYYRRDLYQGEGSVAARAAQGLANLGTKRALALLFRFAANPPLYRNAQIALTALEYLDYDAIDKLIDAGPWQNPAERLLLVRLIANHPEAVLFLAEFTYDDSPVVQSAAIKGLAAVNSRMAAQALRDLSGVIDKEIIAEALSRITDPAGPEYLRAIQPDSTTITGSLCNERLQYMPHTAIQIVSEHYFDETRGWDWKPLSIKTTTNEDGRFIFSLLPRQDEIRPHLKVTSPRQPDGSGGDVYYAPLDLTPDRTNHVNARLDTFFKRLIVSVSSSE